MPKTIIIIPTYNERENVRSLVSQIFALSGDISILFIDDNSPDQTSHLCEEMAEQYEDKIFVLHRERKLGLGTAYICGFRWALGRDYEFIFTMDADLSHNPVYIPEFLDRIKDSDCVVGSRYIQGVSVVNWPIHRIILSSLANRYVRIITNLPLTDCTSGYTCIRREVLRGIRFRDIHSEGYAFLVELKYLIFKAGYKIKEIPIIFIERKKGRTKLSFPVFIEGLVVPLRLRCGAQ